MEQAKLDRINALTRLSRERALTEAEQAERQTLRAEYLEEWRRGAKQVLENTYIVGADGSRRPLRPRNKQS